MHTQVVIIGAGPAGLMLGHLLRQAGIDVLVLERQSREHVLGRIRAGVLEPITIEVMERLGLAARLHTEALAHDGFCLAAGDRMIHIDVRALTGRTITVYGQTELTRDLVDAAADRGLPIVWEAHDVTLHDVDGNTPWVSYRCADAAHRVDARFIAGCDGFHGPSRGALPRGRTRVFERVFPFGWLGILAEVPPCHPEVLYANHERGFALASMRSLERSRYYIQVPHTETLAAWPDERLWEELCRRLPAAAAARVVRGPALEKSIAALRAYVCEPMQHGALFLAGDAAHIVPPTGAKGLNLAAADVSCLAAAMIDFFETGTRDALETYSTRALARVWRAERFSWQLTRLTHRFDEDTPLDLRLQAAEFDQLERSEAARRVIAENYLGLPL